ncbi:TPA: hypothetical protein ACGOYW_001743 [Streptococcus suis]
MSIEFKGAKLTVKLKCQAPIIHFQPNTKGATLRASEVKPKFDRYLAKHCQKIASAWKVDPGKEALNYKMSFVDKSPEIVENWPRNIIYFGDKEGKKLVWTNPTLTITCFIPELQQAICEHLEKFFIVTNFGTMQGKGFGSFLVEGSTVKSVMTLMQEYNLDTIHRVETCKDFTSQMRFIKQFYTLTKSGNNSGIEAEYKRSALFEYMHTKNIDNEKAYLKQEGIMVKAGTHKPHKVSEKNNPKYVRIVLGQAPVITVRERNVKGLQGKVTIRHSAKSIDRFPSPLTFKIINNYIYIIPKPIPKEIFNQNYQFTSKIPNNIETRTLRTLSEFDLQDFLNYAVKYYNTGVKNAFPNNQHIIKTFARRR